MSSNIYKPKRSWEYMKIPNWLKVLAIGGIINLATQAKGSVTGFVHNSRDGVSGGNIPVKIYRKQITGGTDTLYNFTNDRGQYIESDFNFEPSLAPGETTFVYAWKDTLGKRWDASLMFIAGQRPYQLDIALDSPDNPGKAFTADLGAAGSSGWIRDTSGIPGKIQGIYWPAKNSAQRCTTQVDTGYTAPLDHYWRGWFNFEKQDSIVKHGDSAYILLEKTLGDTAWQTLLPFTIDTTCLGAMPVADTLYFPTQRIITDTTAPVISNATQWSDTTFKGPYVVSWARSDNAGIISDSLEYRINQGDVKKSPADSVKGDTAYATIDSIVADGDSVYYKVESADNSSNNNKACWPAIGMYGFKTTKVGIDEAKSTAKGFIIDGNPCINGAIVYNKDNGKFDLELYNLAGQNVEKIRGAENSVKIANKQPAGTYFAKIYGKDGRSEVKKLIKIR